MVVNKSYPRSLQTPEESFFLFGLRGSGKSTWARERFGGARRVDLLDERRYQDYLRAPGLFGDELRDLPRGAWVVVDEVQRLPGLLNEVHRAIEERGLRFALLGSSARKLKTAGTNLLAGRALRREMHPFLPEELGKDFSLPEALRFGTLPIVQQSPDKRERLEAYVQLYLREEVQAEALVRNLPGFARFLPIAALFHGQAVNTAAIARDAGVARTTVSGYLEILRDTHLVAMLPAFEARLRVRERRHPKLYWTDAGVVRAMKRQYHVPAPEERGPLLEGWVAGLLRARQAYAGLCDEIAYWAPAHGGAEVDFLLRRGRRFTAVEVKATTRPGPADVSGLRAVADLAGLERRILVCLAARPSTTPQGVEVLPAARFAGELAAGRI